MAIENNNSTTPVKEKDLAQTPWWFIRSLEAHLGKKITLDVCAQPTTAKCEIYYALEDGNNALESKWFEDYKEITESDGRDAVAWCNPPFSDCLNWVQECIRQVAAGMPEVWLLLPNNPETEYIRRAKSIGFKIIEMPFRMKFKKPDGTEFLDTNGKQQSPKFSCMIAVLTKEAFVHGSPEGYKNNPEYYYHDFRDGFYRV